MDHRPGIKTSIITLVSIMCLHPARAAVCVQDKPDEIVILAEGTALNIVTAQEISSKTANPGDPINFKVDEDVLVSGHVVISKGTLAKGSVINAEPSGHLGKSGKLGITVESTNTVDGQPVKLRAAKGQEGRDKTSSTVALSMVVSPFFLLKKGTDAKIAEGTPLNVYVAEEKRFRVEGSSLIGVNPPVNAVAKTGSPGNADGNSSASDSATVFIYRPEKLLGKALEPSVFCDGVELARMDNGRYFALRLKPGKHIVHMTDRRKGFAIDMGSGQTYYFRVGVEMGMWKGQGKLTMEDGQKALPEIKKVRFIGQDKIKDHMMIVEVDPNKPAP